MFETKIMTIHSILSKKSALPILLGIFPVIIGSVVWFGILPLKQSLLNKARMIQEFYVDEENQSKQINRLPELEDQYNIIENNASKLDIMLREDQVIDFIKTLETLASETTVTLVIASKDTGKIVEPKATAKKTVSEEEGETKTSPSSTPKKEKVKEVDILSDIPFDRYLRLSISATGKYENIINFLHKIETLSVGLDVVGIDIKRAEIEKNTKKVVTGSGVFSSGVVSISDALVSEKENPETKDMLEGVFDLVVYVNK